MFATSHRIPGVKRLVALLLAVHLIVQPVAVLAQVAGSSAGSLQAGASAASRMAGISAMASSLPPGTLPPGLEAEVQLLQQQVKQLRGNWGNLGSSVPPVIKTAQMLDSLPDQFKPRVDAIKAKYNIPANPTLGQEARGLVRYGMDRVGIAPQRQSVIMKSIDQTARNARTFRPMDPMNIALAVGSVAGMNLISQVATTGQVDIGKAVGFIGTPQFWGGLVGSGVGYSLASVVLTSLLPPGGSLLASVLPTFGAMTSAILGGRIGSAGFDMSKALEGIDFGEVVGQAAGSTVGLFMGGTIGQFLGGTLGGMAGPIGTVVGSMVMGYIGGAIGRGITALFQGDTQALTVALDTAKKVVLEGQAFVPSDIGVSDELPGARFYNDSDSVRVKSEYRQHYTDFVAAAQSGDKKRAAEVYDDLIASRKQYEQIVRTSFKNMAAEQARQ